MLVEFSVENFRSFREREALSLVSSKTRSANRELDRGAIFRVNNIDLLKAAAIYGANASGKSNLIRALQFVKHFVDTSATERGSSRRLFRIEPFRLSTTTEGAASRFETILIKDGQVFRYGFSATNEQVEEEWLHVSSNGKREKVLFKRSGSTLKMGREFEEGKELISKTRPNALFLSVCATWNGPIATKVSNWFDDLDILSGLSDTGFYTSTLGLLNDKATRDEISRLVCSLDVGIKGVGLVERADELEKIEIAPDDPDAEFLGTLKELTKAISKHMKEKGTQANFRATSLHEKFDGEGKPVGTVEFTVDSDESEGTKKLVAFAGPVVTALTKSKVLVIDEFDARLHPLVSQEIVALFNGHSTNPNGAQLIFATHDTNLLDRNRLRRDQIWLTEKDSTGATHLSSLVEYRIRNDASFEKGYLQGRYGAIPYIGNFRALIHKKMANL